MPKQLSLAGVCGKQTKNNFEEIDWNSAVLLHHHQQMGAQSRGMCYSCAAPLVPFGCLPRYLGLTTCCALIMSPSLYASFEILRCNRERERRRETEGELEGEGERELEISSFLCQILVWRLVHPAWPYLSCKSDNWGLDAWLKLKAFHSQSWQP